MNILQNKTVTVTKSKERVKTITDGRRHDIQMGPGLDPGTRKKD